MVWQAVALDFEQFVTVVQLEVLLKSFEDILNSYVLDSCTDDKPPEDTELADVPSFHKKCVEVASGILEHNVPVPHN